MTREELLQLIDKAADEGWTKLDLAGLELEELPAQIGKCTQLETLVLGKYDEEKRQLLGNKLTEFPDVVLQLTNLKILDLSKNQITVIPEAIGQLFNLTQLDLNSNQITSIPEAIGQLSNLTELDLNNNQISEIPKAIGQLSNLTQLDLRINQISEIPEAIAQLSNLTQLYFSENQITSIPEAIGQLSNLTELDLMSNQITVIPEAIGQLSNLTQLYLGINQITIIPEAIGQLSNLTLLDLMSNQITVIPEAIRQLSNLTLLDLMDNEITAIPEAIGQLSNLTQLYLSNNQITLIPEAIGQLSNLTRLYLDSNQITSIPEAIRGMEKLEQLYLQGNPIPIPPEILQGDLRTILDFYFQTRNPNDTEELYEAKLLIVGEGEAGKTTLAKKLLKPDYKLQKQEPSTEGIDVSRWEFPHNGKTFRVHIWDFGGQEIYHATHQFFLTERSFYILLVDNRRENPNLCYWLSIIELLSSASPVLLVHNEKQDRRCEINVSQLRGDFANLKESLNTNLADNRGLDELQRYLQNNITQLDHIGIPIPKRWANVRHVVENSAQGKNRIPVSEFYEICAQQGFDKSDKPAMLGVSKYLHHLGIILHFQKDPILKHLVILRPEWATNAVYKVTDNEQVIANYGHFTDENLSEIWSDDEYDDLHDELLQLMKSFKVCYEIGKSGNYIAPQRLPLEPPKYDWDDSDNLIVRYEYEFMPKGIITRLIVEMHRFIYRIKSTDFVWREGVLLTDNYATAEVIENYHQREIRIRVFGNQKTYLLNKIRTKLEEIHADYDKRLKYQEFIPCNCAKCKGSQNPHLYAFDKLRRRLDNRKYTVECEISYENVNVRGLMDDFPDYSRQWEQERLSGIDRSDPVESSRERSSSSPNVQIIFTDNKMTQDSPQNNNLQGAQIGSMAIAKEVKDRAQQTASGGIHINNANTAELLQLILSMRKTVEQFPENIRNEIIPDIEDIEIEIDKPENARDKTRLGKRLTALIAAGTAIAIQIPGAIDLANNAIDLGQKVGIELKLPSAP
jgi:internalin A